MIRSLLLLLTAFPLAGCAQVANEPPARIAGLPERPNFVFFLVDDQPFDALQSEGRYPFLQTPNMQRLEKEGVKFARAFSTMSLCSPSRASFLTGVYPHVHGVNQNHHAIDPDWERFPAYPQLLQEAGYETAFVGKLHMAHRTGEAQVRPGYDYWLGFEGQGEYFDPVLNENGRDFRASGYMTDILTDYAIEWLETRRDPGKPFSLNLWHKAVHEPYLPPPRHADLYEGEVLPEPPYGTARETFRGKPEWQRIKQMDSRWREYVPVEAMPEREWDENNPRFMALLKTLKAVDESLGRMLASLEKTGELDNTIIIFGSDNGYFMGEHTYWDKRIAYEPSMRIPLLMRLPGPAEDGRVIDELVVNIDLAPTLLEFAGARVPAHIQGRSLAPLLAGRTPQDWRRAILFQYYVDEAYPYAGPTLLAARSDRYKLVDNNLENDIDEFYDLAADPGEMVNLIAVPGMQDEIARHRRLLADLRKRYDYNPERDWWLDRVLAVGGDNGPAPEADLFGSSN